MGRLGGCVGACQGGERCAGYTVNEGLAGFGIHSLYNLDGRNQDKRHCGPSVVDSGTSNQHAEQVNTQALGFLEVAICFVGGLGEQEPEIWVALVAKSWPLVLHLLG